MRRGTQFRLVFVCALTMAALGAGPLAARAADPAAIEEYVLTLPGVKSSGAGQPEPLVQRAQRIGPTGVTGERNEAPTMLAAIGSATASPAGIAVVLALGAGAALAAKRSRNAV